MDFNKALIFPKTEKTIPVTAAIRITAGLVTFVKDTAPVTSEYVVTGDIPDVFDDRSDGHGNHVDNGFPREIGSYELGKGKPSGFFDRGGVHVIEEKCHEISNNDSAEYRD